jgi:hypothetical protein
VIRDYTCAIGNIFLLIIIKENFCPWDGKSGFSIREPVSEKPCSSGKITAGACSLSTISPLFSVLNKEAKYVAAEKVRLLVSNLHLTH